MSTAQTRFENGDRVLHPGKPEWGVGHVARASAETHEGQPVQRLTVRFERAGVKTLSTAHAKLSPAPDEAPRPLADAQTGEPEPQTPPSTETMTRLPEPARDPFATPIERLRQTLSLYRFSKEGGALLDWAAMQSGLVDPLSQFSRHDLEDLHDRFSRTLDQHLGAMVIEVKRAVGSDLRAADIQKVIADAPPRARAALQRVARWR